MTIVLWVAFWACIVTAVIFGVSNKVIIGEIERRSVALRRTIDEAVDLRAQFREEIAQLRDSLHRTGPVMGMMIIAAALFAIAARIG